MEENKTSVLSNGLIWFGAGVSMSEILTGTYFAPLGMKTGLLAILIGHVIGCILLFLAGYLGAKTNNNAMETVAVSFGRKGNLPFSILNILQLAGWLAILNYDGALQRMVFFLQEQVCGVPSSGCYACVGSGRFKTLKKSIWL